MREMAHERDSYRRDGTRERWHMREMATSAYDKVSRLTKISP